MRGVINPWVTIEPENIYLMDCLEGMTYIADGSIDLIATDLPYAMTNNQWDSLIPFDQLWTAYKRILKPTGAVVLTGIQPFTSALVMSNPKWFRCEWIWEKEQGTGFLNCHKYPLRSHESVLVFAAGKHTYNPQMVPGKPYTSRNKGRPSTNYRPDLIRTPTINETGDRYPKTVLRFKRDKHKLHPTQKPVALFAYLIKTYSNPGGVVLDSCIGSGTTCVSAIQTGRRYLGFETDPGYFKTAQQRIAEATQEHATLDTLF